MYGTHGRMQPKAGKRDELIRMMSTPPAGEAAKGYRGSYLLKADEDDVVVLAVITTTRAPTTRWSTTRR